MKKKKEKKGDETDPVFFLVSAEKEKERKGGKEREALLSTLQDIVIIKARKKKKDVARPILLPSCSKGGKGEEAPGLDIYHHRGKKKKKRRGLPNSSFKSVGKKEEREKKGKGRDCRLLSLFRLEGGKKEGLETVLFRGKKRGEGRTFLSLYYEFEKKGGEKY